MGNLSEFANEIMTLGEVEKEAGMMFSTFVETGAGNGTSILCALARVRAGSGSVFKKVISIEIVPETVHRIRKMFQHEERLEVVEGSSRKKLQGVLEEATGDCLIFLDAHCPGQFNPDVDRTKVRLRYSEADQHPLKDELEICMKFNHVVLIDDAKQIVQLDMVKRQLTDGWEMRYYNIAKGYLLLIPPA